jgi:diguanylate cyclase (GGDEF)-like protein
MRISDTVARLAGDEFALILYDVQSASDIEIVAQKISTALGQPIPALEGMMTITASIGVSLFPKHGADADSLFKKADQAMYLVKGQSKNGYRVAA